MHREALRPDPVPDEVRLLVEAGLFPTARSLAAELAARHPDDPELLRLRAWVDQRAGRVSDALDTWRQIHDVVPSGNGAMVRLAQLGAELGAPRQDLPLVRRVLRLVATGAHQRALAASRHDQAAAAAAGDQEQQKLLALIEALLHELAGQPAAAVAVLTRLGQQPAFTEDVDRLAILARVCEQAGDRVGLEAAERVLHFLAGAGLLSAYPRLVQIRRSLGDAAGATSMEERWEEAFSTRIQRLAPPARLAAALRRYVPLERLRQLALPSAEEVDDLAAAALRLLVDGDPRLALERLQGPWRAEACLQAGRTAAALEESAAALERCADLPTALLLGRCLAHHPLGRPRREVLATARALLEEACATGPADGEWLAARAAIEERAGNGAAAAALRLRATAARKRPWPPAGVVRAAAVYALPGRSLGLVHELVVRRYPAGSRDRGRLLDGEVHGELDRQARAILRRTFAAVREVLASRYPERRATFERSAFGIHVTKEDETSGGPSLGLPAAVAFASALLDEPVPSHLVFTGALSYDAAGVLAVRPVGELGRKLEAALLVGASALVLPAMQLDEAVGGGVVPRRFATGIARPVASFDEALALVRSAASSTPSRVAD